MAPPGPAPRRLYCHTRRGLNVEDYGRGFEAGRQPESSPYGLDGLVEHGWEVVWSRDRKLGPVASAVETALRRILGFDLVHALANARRFKSAAVAYAHTDPETLALCALRLVTRSKTQVRSNVIWLGTRWQDTPWWQRWLHGHLMRAAQILVVNSLSNVAFLEESIPSARVSYVTFGSPDLSTSPVAPEVAAFDQPDVDVAVIGNDQWRDWEAVKRVAIEAPRFSIAIASHSSFADMPSNVRTSPCKNTAEIVQAYRGAKLILVPTLTNLHASGITVMMEAASLGRPMVATENRDLLAYFNGDEVLYVPATASLTQACTALLANEEQRIRLGSAARRAFEKHAYDRDGFLNRLHQALSR